MTWRKGYSIALHGPPQRDSTLKSQYRGLIIPEFPNYRVQCALLVVSGKEVVLETTSRKSCVFFHFLSFGFLSLTAEE